MTEPTALSVADAIDAYIADRAARGEISAYTARQFAWRLSGLAAERGDTPIGELSRRHLRAWQARSGGNQPASRRAYLSTMRVFVRWCIDEGLLEEDPTRGLGRVKEPWKEPRALDADALRALRAALPDLEARLIVALMAVQGLRCIEVARLAGPDWDRGRARIVVRGKAGEERSLPLAVGVETLLAGWVGERRLGPVIGRTRQEISKRVSGWMAAAGLKDHNYDGVSAHALRHTAASNLYDACGDIKAVQRFLGHANVATTDRYLRYGDDETIRAGLEPDRRMSGDLVERIAVALADTRRLQELLAQAEASLARRTVAGYTAAVAHLEEALLLSGSHPGDVNDQVDAALQQLREFYVSREAR